MLLHFAECSFLLNVVLLPSSQLQGTFLVGDTLFLLLSFYEYQVLLWGHLSFVVTMFLVVLDYVEMMFLHFAEIQILN